MSSTEGQIASRNTLRACVILFGVGLARIPLDLTRYGVWPLGAATLGHTLLAGGLALWLWRRGARTSARTSDVLYALVLLPHLVTLWLPQIYEHRGGTLVEPMFAHHTLLLAIALLPPSNLRLAFALLATFAVQAVVLWLVLERVAPSPTLEREPWFTLVTAGIAGGVLWSRVRRRELEIRLILAEARARALDQYNRVLLALRDRANSPLQTLEIAIAVLEQQPAADADPTLRRAVAAMRRAMAQLIAAQQPLAQAGGAERAAQLAIDLERELRALHAPPS